jgi:hypothetical protein
MLSDAASFVRLNWTNEVPFQVLAAQQLLFSYRLLHVVFSEPSLPSTSRLGNVIRGVSLAYGQQRDRTLAALKPLFGVSNPGNDGR